MVDTKKGPDALEGVQMTSQLQDMLDREDWPKALKTCT